jgi:hypothetical protein
VCASLILINAGWSLLKREKKKTFFKKKKWFVMIEWEISGLMTV